MANKGQHKVGKQHLLKRRRLYVLPPGAALVVLVSNLVWLAVRANVPEGQLSTWPWRLKLLDFPDTLAAIGIIAGVHLAYFGWEHAYRPTIRYTDDWASTSPPSNTSVLHDSRLAREMHLGNAGPGVAVIDSIAYSVCFDGERESTTEWLDEYRLRETFIRRGFVDQQDYHFNSTGPGYPLPPTQNSKDGFLFAAFSAETILKIAAFDVRLRVRDNLGNTYERVLLVAQTHDKTGLEKEPPYYRIIRRRLAEELSEKRRRRNR